MLSLVDEEIELDTFCLKIRELLTTTTFTTRRL